MHPPAELVACWVMIKKIINKRFHGWRAFFVDQRGKRRTLGEKLWRCHGSHPTRSCPNLPGTLYLKIGALSRKLSLRTKGRGQPFTSGLLKSTARRNINRQRGRIGRCSDDGRQIALPFLLRSSMYIVLIYPPISLKKLLENLSM